MKRERFSSGCVIDIPRGRERGLLSCPPNLTPSRTATARCGGSWRPFLPSFNLTFPANGQPGVNSTALIATRNSPHQRRTLPSRHPSPLKNPTAFPPPSFPLFPSSLFSFLLPLALFQRSFPSTLNSYTPSKLATEWLFLECNAPANVFVKVQ